MVEPQRNAFLQLLTELEGGQTQNDLAQAVTNMVGEVRSRGKGGTITIKLTFTPPRANSAQMGVVVDVKEKPPAPERDITVLYADDNNQLSRRDPRQPRLSGVEADVRSFSRPVAVNETVDKATGEVKES